MEYDVVVWRGTLSDGSICYTAVCPAIDHAHGQADTETGALIDVADTMALFLEHQPTRFKTGQAAQDEVSELISDLAKDGTACWVKRVAPARNWLPA